MAVFGTRGLELACPAPSHCATRHLYQGCVLVVHAVCFCFLGQWKWKCLEHYRVVPTLKFALGCLLNACMARRHPINFSPVDRF